MQRASPSLVLFGLPEVPINWKMREWRTLGQITATSLQISSCPAILEATGQWLTVAHYLTVTRVILAFFFPQPFSGKWKIPFNRKHNSGDKRPSQQLLIYTTDFELSCKRLAGKRRRLNTPLKAVHQVDINNARTVSCSPFPFTYLKSEIFISSASSFRNSSFPLQYFFFDRVMAKCSFENGLFSNKAEKNSLSVWRWRSQLDGLSWENWKSFSNAANSHNSHNFHNFHIQIRFSAKNPWQLHGTATSKGWGQGIFL